MVRVDGNTVVLVFTSCTDIFESTLLLLEIETGGIGEVTIIRISRHKVMRLEGTSGRDTLFVHYPVRTFHWLILVVRESDWAKSRARYLKASLAKRPH